MFWIFLIIFIFGTLVISLLFSSEISKITNLKNNKKKIIQEIKELEEEKKKLETSYKDCLESFEKEFKEQEENLEKYKSTLSFSKEQYLKNIEHSYTVAESEYRDCIGKLKNEIKDAKNQFNELQNSINAGIQAQLREREREENLQFYKIYVSEEDIEDIKTLNSLKKNLRNPVILSKLIWTQFFQKQTTEMCNRILGTEKVCGIYKITNLKTQQCYIGQSVDISKRFKDHCKCGCDIDASKTNKLYQSMIKEGLWNFSFELLEKCSRDELDKKEKQWIKIYQANIYGLNSNSGNN